MSAKGKINTVGLASGVRILVQRTENPEVVKPSPTKRKGAEVMTVVRREEVVVGQRQRRAYDVMGITDDAQMVKLVAVSGNQTYWRAT